MSGVAGKRAKGTAERGGKTLALLWIVNVPEASVLGMWHCWKVREPLRGVARGVL